VTDVFSGIQFSDTSFDFADLPRLGLDIGRDRLGSKKGFRTPGASGQSFETLLRFGVDADREGLCHMLCSLVYIFYDRIDLAPCEKNRCQSALRPIRPLHACA